MNYKYIEISERLPDYEELVWEVNHMRKFVLLIFLIITTAENKCYFDNFNLNGKNSSCELLKIKNL